MDPTGMVTLPVGSDRARRGPPSRSRMPWVRWEVFVRFGQPFLRLSSLVLLSSVLVAGAPASTSLQKQPSTSLLKDRLTLRLPKDMRIQARAHSIMSAPQPTEEETRAVLDAGEERLVLMAAELFERGGADPDRSVRATVAEFKPPPLKVEPLQLSSQNLKAWAVFPASIDRSRSAILLLSVYALHPDGFMQLLNFYVNPPAAKGAGCSGLARVAGAGKLPQAPGELPTCTALVHAIASTLEAGTRRIDSAGGERKLTGQYNDDSFFVKVPAGTGVTAQSGHDFTVHHVRLPVDLGEPQPSLGIYVGGHPSYQYKQNDAQVTPTRKPGKVFGKDVSWQVWSESPKSVMAEVIVDHPQSKNARVHLFASAADEKALAPMLDIAASLRLP